MTQQASTQPKEKQSRKLDIPAALPRSICVHASVKVNLGCGHIHLSMSPPPACFRLAY
jgi:hypothetical protein